MFLDWGSTLDHLPELLKAAGLTLYISAYGFGMALLIASLAAAGRLSSHRLARGCADVYVQVIRNTPLLLQIYLVFYGLPSMGIRLSATNAAILGLALNVGAYLAEIFRSGVVSVPQGQLEAARALGMGSVHRLLYIIVPVCLRNVFPSVTNMAIATLLGASLASVIAVAELTGQTNAISARTFLTIELYAIAAVIYIAMTLGTGLLMGVLQNRLFPRRSRA